MVQSMPSGIALWGCPPAHRRTMSSQLIVHRWPKTCSHRPFPCSCRRGAACLGSTTYPRWESDGGSLGTPFRTTFRVHFWYPFGVHFGSSFGAKNGSQNPPQRGYVGVLNVPQSDSRRGQVGFPDMPTSDSRRGVVGFRNMPLSDSRHGLVGFSTRLRRTPVGISDRPPTCRPTYPRRTLVRVVDAHPRLW